MTDHKIWDPFIRLFHWSLVAGFAANALILDDESKVHEWVGYAVVALVGLRLLWGFVGPLSARFASFFPSQTAVMEQIGDIATHRRRAHLGHSPLGALMIFNLLAVMLAIGVTGYMMTTDAYWGVEWVEEAHEMLVVWAEISVVLHIAAVVFESWRTGVNLPRAMITGKKSVPDDVRLAR
ncbi:Cytochrome b [Roseovarius mucosus DSM 17069]|jgi:cytochrome b|uniref:Cytochrome b n=1 Tax=Roseovarius mucosus DSM 17069 TaxID=1288298 RepID=A0A0A0HFW2_9RHOB|nr:cytochrome b/b6 domain-containing protein [Roseovarius mucosus]KGM86657.1 Cytochrome b [Roseovarius mucosus DSM 17069]MAN99179.1 cytochrome B [Roseovarius sp.]|tara:strand:- start:246 stop:785 length:540 start_codon:yes stop_codon:yes gene_type:complete